MSLQEAASSGSFNPRAAQPTNPQPSDGPFVAPGVDTSVDQASAEAASPFGASYDYSPSTDEVLVDGSGPDLRATRRRAWTVVGLAIVIPAAVAGVIAWQLFGTDAEPAPTVTRVTTTPAEPVARQVQTTTTAPVEAAAAAQSATDTTTVAVATASTTEVTTASTATEAEATEAAAVATQAEVDLASLDPAARLAAWTDLETIQVLPGETLWLIAQNYNTTISAIATLNGISDPETLSIGQQLVIPVGFAEEIAETAPALAAEPGSGTSVESDGSVAITATATAGAATETPDDLANWHTIVPVSIEDGDSLEAIAVANNTSVGAIMALNGLTDPNLIFVGVELLVPVGYQGDVPIPDVGLQPVQQVSTDVSTDDAGTVAADEQTSATDDLMEEESTGAAAADDDMMEE